MNCKVEYIEQAYRTVHSEFADVLTNAHHSIFNRVKQWNNENPKASFTRKESDDSKVRFTFATNGSAAQKKQAKFVQQLNRENPSNNDVPVVHSVGRELRVNVLRGTNAYWKKMNTRSSYIDGKDDARGDLKKDVSIKERIFKGKEESTIKEVLLEIQKNPVYSKIASTLLKNTTKTANLPIYLLSKEGLDEKNSRGFYYPSEKIEIAEFANAAKGNMDGVMLHEIIHALTIPLLERNETIAKDWVKLWEYAKDIIEEDHYGLKNEEEFASELFVNSKFILTLKKYPASNQTKYKNLWEEVLTFIKDLLGFQNESLYDEAVAMLSNIIEQEANTNYQRELEEEVFNKSFVEVDENDFDTFIPESIEKQSPSLTTEQTTQIEELKQSDVRWNISSNFVRNVNELGEQFEKSPYESKSYKIQQIQTILKKELPVGIVNSVTIVNDVPSSILGRNDLFLSLKNILNDNGINDELLINWVGLNKDKIGYSPYAIHYESTIENIIKKSYEKKKNESEYLEFKTNKLAKESFYKWIESLEKYPLAFKEVMLTHAVKWLNNPNRKSKYVLQLSDVALQNAYGIVVNKPHELNRIGKLYDQEVLKTVSDAVKHEPSASGNGYWVHVPKTSNEDKKQFDINIELLKKLSPSTWCTSGGLTRHYVENYDNYILIVNGITVAGIEVTDKINSNNQRIVKEVTSRNNNGIASVDHLDDTVAFFEKHNLDLSNESLQNAIKAKENDKTDKDLGNEYEEEPWLNYDFEPRDFYDFEDDNIPDNRQEFLEPWEEELNMLYDYNIEQALAYLESEKEGKVLSAFSPLVMSNEEVVKKIIQIDPEMIVEVNPLLTFYLEVAHQAVLKKPSVYSYISEEAKQEKRNIDLYNEYLAQVRDRVKEGDDLPFSKTINNQIQGYYDANNDKVVLIANNIDVNEASKIAIHEIAHRGMIRMGKELGGMNELNQILLNAESELMKKLPELLKRTGHSTLEELVKDYGFTINSKEGKSKLLMELAARWAETLVNKSKPSWWKEFIQSIKNWIKQFTGKTLNENKVNELVGGFVKYGTQNKNLNSFIFESFKEDRGEDNIQCFI